MQGRSMQAAALEAYLRAAGTKRMFLTRDAALGAMEGARKSRLRPPRAPRYPRMAGSVRMEEADGHWVCTITPAQARDDLSVFYIHGGAYVMDPIVHLWRMLDRLAAELKAPVTVPLYPKAPEGRHAESAAFMLDRYREHCARHPGRVILGGDSAGGGFALALSQTIRDRLESSDRSGAEAGGLRAPDLLVLLSPWLDLTLANPGIPGLEPIDPVLSALGLRVMGEAWAGSEDPRAPALSPINGRLHNLPPTLLSVGTKEIFLADARAFRELAAGAGMRLRYEETADMVHVFPILPIPEAERLRSAIVEEASALLR